MPFKSHRCNSVNLVITKLYKSLKLINHCNITMETINLQQVLDTGVYHPLTALKNYAVYLKYALYLSKLTNSLLVTWWIWFLSVMNNNVYSVTITMATEHKCMKSLKGNAYIIYIHILVIYIDSFISLDFFLSNII
jgi:hypothetical protein